jgi:hypothetical protein
MKNGIAVALALVVGLAGGYLLRGRGADAPANDLDALNARIAALEARDGDASAPGATRTPSTAPGPRGGANGPRFSEPPPTPEALDQQRREGEARRRGALERGFAGLTAAPAKDPAPPALEKAFENPLVLEAAGLPVDETITCRSTMCLVSARFAPGQDSADWTNRVLMEVAAELPLASVVNVPTPDGGFEVRIYAARPGESLPDF